MNIDSIDSTVLFAIAVAGIVQALVLYLIINIATKADKRTKYEWAQMDLLGKIAMRQGVSAEEISNTYRAAGLKK